MTARLGVDLVPWMHLDEFDGHPFGRLVAMMYEFSEEYDCSSWASSCEHYLWDLANKPGRWGVGTWSVEITPQEASRMLDLARECGGWPAPSEDGIVLVPMIEWLERHAAWRAIR